MDHRIESDPADRYWDDRKVPVIAPQWHIRINAGAGLAYIFSNDDYMYAFLSANEMVALAFCDGITRLGEVRTLVSEALSVPSGDARRIIQGLTENYNGREPVLIPLQAPGTEFTRINAARVLHELSIRPSKASKTIRLDVPLTLLFMPTYRCRTDCVYCYSPRPEIARKDEMPPQRWCEIIEEAGSLGIDRVTFSGGDPLMYPGISELLEVCARYRMCYILPTKTPVRPKRARTLARVLSAHGEIQISVDSFDPDVAAYMTKTPGYADQARQSIRNLRNAGVSVTTNTVVTPHNLATVSDLIRELRNLGVHKANITNYNRSGYRHDDGLMLSVGQVTQLNESVARIREALGWEQLSCNAEVRDFSVPGANTEEAWVHRANCSGGFSAMCILPDGDVTLCEQVPNEPAFVVGSVRQQSLMEVWNSKRLLEFISPDRSRFRGTACAQCEEFDVCHTQTGRCFKDSYLSFGKIFAPSPNCPKAPRGLRMA